MQWADLLSRTLIGLAWPSVALVAILMFRGPVADAIGRIRQASAFGATVELFEKRVRELRVETRSTVEAAPMSTTPKNATQAKTYPEMDQIEREFFHARQMLPTDDRGGDTFIAVMNAVDATVNRARQVAGADDLDLSAFEDRLVEKGLKTETLNQLKKLVKYRHEMVTQAIIPSSEAGDDMVSAAENIDTQLRALL